jgi:predicted transcriptional regulator
MSQEQDQPKTICSNCGAKTFNRETGKCEKCDYTATLEDFGFEIHRMKNKTFILTKKGEADPLSTFSNVTSRLEKKNVAQLTNAPWVVVERTFALLAIEPKEKPKPKANKESEKDRFSKETTIKAWELLRDPSFFFKLGDVFEKGFIVPKINKPRFVLGEERNKRLLGPLIIGAAKLGMTSIIRVIGTPGTAKDTMVRMCLELSHLSYIERSYLTAAAIRYSQNIQDADLLYIPDTPRMQGEAGRQMLFMRSDDGGLISEYATRDTETGEMTTKTVTLPIKGVVTTSNEVIAGAALTSGMWTLTTNADLELTEKVKEEKLKLRARERGLLPDAELDIWRCAFKLLLTEELPENNVIIPYAKELISIIGSERSESRRDPDKLCDLIALIAWMRRFQKPEEERDVADFADLYIALQIGLDAIRETMSGLSEKETQILEALIKLCHGSVQGVSIRSISEETKIPYKTVYRILEDSLLEKGYATKDKEGNRNFYKSLNQ